MSGENDLVTSLMRAQENQSTSLYAHLTELLELALGETNPHKQLAHFEILSDFLKKHHFRYQDYLDSEAVLRLRPRHSASRQWAKLVSELLLYSRRPDPAAHLQSLAQDRLMLEQCGVRLGEESELALEKAMAQVANLYKVKRLRFWGKFLGRAEYFVLQGVSGLAYDDQSSPGSELRGEGANLYTYWVTKNLFQGWVELPLVTPEQVHRHRGPGVTARLLPRLPRPRKALPQGPDRQDHARLRTGSQGPVQTRLGQPARPGLLGRVQNAGIRGPDQPGELGARQPCDPGPGQVHALHRPWLDRGAEGGQVCRAGREGPRGRAAQGYQRGQAYTADQLWKSLALRPTGWLALWARPRPSTWWARRKAPPPATGQCSCGIPAGLAPSAWPPNSAGPTITRGTDQRPAPRPSTRRPLRTSRRRRRTGTSSATPTLGSLPMRWSPTATTRRSLSNNEHHSLPQPASSRSPTPALHLCTSASSRPNQRPTSFSPKSYHRLKKSATWVLRVVSLEAESWYRSPSSAIFLPRTSLSSRCLSSSALREAIWLEAFMPCCFSWQFQEVSWRLLYQSESILLCSCRTALPSSSTLSCALAISADWSAIWSLLAYNSVSSELLSPCRDSLAFPIWYIYSLSLRCRSYTSCSTAFSSATCLLECSFSRCNCSRQPSRALTSSWRVSAERSELFRSLTPCCLQRSSSCSDLPSEALSWRFSSSSSLIRSCRVCMARRYDLEDLRSRALQSRSLGTVWKTRPSCSPHPKFECCCNELGRYMQYYYPPIGNKIQREPQLALFLIRYRSSYTSPTAALQGRLCQKNHYWHRLQQ